MASENERERIRVACEECDWRGTWGQILTADNPFNPGTTLEGCPRCLEVNTTYRLCDEPECPDQATCGTPTPKGYRQVCGHHYRALTPNAAAQGRER